MYEYMCCLPPCLRWRRSYMPPENVVPALLRKKIDPNLRLTMHDLWSLAGGLVMYCRSRSAMGSTTGAPPTMPSVAS